MWVQARTWSEATSQGSQPGQCPAGRRSACRSARRRRRKGDSPATTRWRKRAQDWKAVPLPSSRSVLHEGGPDRNGQLQAPDENGEHHHHEARSQKNRLLPLELVTADRRDDDQGDQRDDQSRRSQQQAEQDDCAKDPAERVKVELLHLAIDRFGCQALDSDDHAQDRKQQSEHGRKKSGPHALPGAHLVLLGKSGKRHSGDREHHARPEVFLISYLHPPPPATFIQAALNFWLTLPGPGASMAHPAARASTCIYLQAMICGPQVSRRNCPPCESRAPTC